MFQVFIISDGTGRTAQQALQAALLQFPNVKIEFHIHAEVRTLDQIKDAIMEAAKVKGTVIHTLVQDNIRHKLVREARKYNVDAIDLMGPLLSRLSDQFENSPSGKPGLFHHLNKEYFQRIDAMQFAFQHDDGLRTHELNKAEIILVGVSRTFKTPLSIFLAFKGWFVANVPVVLNVELPKKLYEVSPNKVYFLTTSPKHLATLRRFREETFNGATGKYAEIEYVRKEIEYANRIYFNHPGWAHIKVTSKPIEEIASEILAIRGSNI